MNIQNAIMSKSKKNSKKNATQLVDENETKNKRDATASANGYKFQDLYISYLCLRYYSENNETFKLCGENKEDIKLEIDDKTTHLYQIKNNDSYKESFNNISHAFIKHLKDFSINKNNYHKFIIVCKRFNENQHKLLKENKFKEIAVEVMEHVKEYKEYKDINIDMVVEILKKTEIIIVDFSNINDYVSYIINEYKNKLNNDEIDNIDIRIKLLIFNITYYISTNNNPNDRYINYSIVDKYIKIKISENIDIDLVYKLLENIYVDISHEELTKIIKTYNILVKISNNKELNKLRDIIIIKMYTYYIGRGAEIGKLVMNSGDNEKTYRLPKLLEYVKNNKF